METRGRRDWTSPSPRSKYHETHVAGISQPHPSRHDNKAGIHPKTQEHIEVQLHQHFATRMYPARTNRPLSPLDMNRKTDGSKKAPKVRSAVFGEAPVRTEGAFDGRSAELDVSAIDNSDGVGGGV